MKRLAGALALGCCLLSARLALAQEPPGGFAEVEGGKVYYEACGSGREAVVLIHDGVLHSAGFDNVWPLLCKRYRVVRFDRRGFGRSPEAKQDSSAVEDLDAVLKAAGVTHATVVGGSEGGGVAVQFAARRPQTVDRLVLVGASIGGLAVSEHFEKRTEALVAALRKGGVFEAANDPYAVAPGHDEARRQALAILAANPQNITHRERRKPAPVTRSLLDQVICPTLILVGERDIADVQAWAGALEALIPDAKRVVMSDAGHLIYLEQPQAFVEQVEGFIGRTKPVRP